MLFRAHKKIIIILFLLLIIQEVFGQEKRGFQNLDQNIGDDIRVGKQYLLVIGLNNYEQWIPLKNPVEDAHMIKNILTSRYYIDSVFEVYNDQGSKANIIRILTNLQTLLKEEDSLIIYYAGHGYFDNTTNTGFWIPINGGLDPFEQANWLAHHQISRLISNIPSKHILLLSDSCFAGDIVDLRRSQKLPNPSDIPYFKEAYKYVSRQVITSGALETVPDESEFSKELGRVLEKNASKFLDPMMMYTSLREEIIESFPLLGSIKETGYEDKGTFLLFLREEYIEDQGSVKITVGNKGDLYIDDDFYGTVDRGSLVINDIEEGAHTLKMKYVNSEIGSYPIVVQAGQTVDIIFPEGDYTANSKSSNFISNFRTSLAVPIGDMAPYLKPGLILNLNFLYNTELNWGNIGIGPSLGLLLEGTREDESNEFNITSVPIEASLSYVTPEIDSFYLLFNIAGGLAVNSIQFPNDSERNLTVIKPCAQFTAEAGFLLGKNLSLSLQVGMSNVFFDNSNVSNVQTGLTLGYVF